MGGEESEDENYPEGPPEVTNKRKKQLTVGQVIEFFSIFYLSLQVC